MQQKKKKKNRLCRASQIKSSMHPRYYAKTCNQWLGHFCGLLTRQHSPKRTKNNLAVGANRQRH